MTLTELIGAFRTAADDTVMNSPLWPDSDVTGYLADAENEACLRARLLIDDSTPDIAVLSLTPGAWVTLSPLVIAVVQAKLGSQDVPLHPRDPEQLNRFWPGWDDSSGLPRQFYIDGERLRLIPALAVADTLFLRVQRLPLIPLTDKGDADSPEIPDRHQAGLLNWALYRAYSRRDVDTFEPNRAEFHRQLFENEFGPRPSARALRHHRENRSHVTRAIGF